MQVTDTTLFELGRRFNQTYQKFHSAELDITRTYLVDVNPWIWERNRGDGDNIIDARFIDTSNGLFLDITGLSANNPDRTNVIECKNEHRYNTTDIFPLRQSSFEGAVAFVPYEYKRVLVEEYSHAALTTIEFHNHTFDPVRAEWVMSKSGSMEDIAPAGGAYS